MIWTLKSEIIGNFFLVAKEELQSFSPPHPSIQKLIVDPEFNNKGEQTGKFSLEIVFVIEADQEKPPPHVPADLGRELLNIIVDLLSFLSGYPVRVIKIPVLTYNYPGTNNFRLINFGEQAFISPPVPLLNTYLFTVKIDSQIERSLSWWRKGLQEKDVINSLLAFFISIEILSNKFKCKEEIIKKCQKCGYETKLDPGMRQRIEHLLIKEIGYSRNQFNSIWGTRNKVTHGAIELTPKNLRELQKTKDELIVAIIKGIKKLLNLGISEPPVEAPPNLPLTDPILDIEYTMPVERKK